MRAFLLLALAAASGVAAHAQDGAAAPPTSDARVETALDASGIVYTQEENGDYRLLYDLDEGRRQLVWVRPATNTFRSMEVREVFATGYVFESPVSEEIMSTLLQQNGSYIIGAWSIEDDRAVFTAQIDADADAETLISTINAVLYSADAFEASISEVDDW